MVGMWLGAWTFKRSFNSVTYCVRQYVHCVSSWLFFHIIDLFKNSLDFRIWPSFTYSCAIDSAIYLNNMLINLLFICRLGFVGFLKNKHLTCQMHWWQVECFSSILLYSRIMFNVHTSFCGYAAQTSQCGLLSVVCRPMPFYRPNYTCIHYAMLG